MSDARRRLEFRCRQLGAVSERKFSDARRRREVRCRQRGAVAERISADDRHNLVGIRAADTPVDQLHIVIPAVLVLRRVSRVSRYRPNLRAPSDEAILRRVPAAVVDRRAAVIGRRGAVGHVGVGLQGGAAVLPGHRIGPHRGGKHRVHIPVSRHAVQRRAVHASSLGLAPACEAVAVLCRAGLGWGAAAVCPVPSVRHRGGVQQGAAVVEIQVAGDVLVHDVDAGIPALHLTELRPGDILNPHRAAHLGLVHVVALLVQATHGVQPVVEGQDVRRRVKAPVEADEPHAGIGRDRRQNVRRWHRAADVLQPQGCDVGVPRQNEVRNAGLVADGQVGDGVRQVQHLQDAAVWQRASGDGRAVEIDVLQARASGEVHRLGHVWAIPHVQSLHQHVVAQIQLRQVGVGVGVGAVAQLQGLQFSCHAELRVAYLQPGEVPNVFDLAGRVNIDFRVVDVVQGTFQGVAAAPQCPGLHQV